MLYNSLKLKQTFQHGKSLFGGWSVGRFPSTASADEPIHLWPWSLFSVWRDAEWFLPSNCDCHSCSFCCCIFQIREKWEGGEREKRGRGGNTYDCWWVWDMDVDQIPSRTKQSRNWRCPPCHHILLLHLDQHSQPLVPYLFFFLKKKKVMIGGFTYLVEGERAVHAMVPCCPVMVEWSEMIRDVPKSA